MNDWYLKIANKEVGPLSSQQLKTMAKKGQLGPEDLIRQGNGGPWVAAGRVKGLLSLATSRSSGSAITPLPTAKAINDTVELIKGADTAETIPIVSNAHRPETAIPLELPPPSGYLSVAESAALPLATPVPGSPSHPGDPRRGSPIPTGSTPSIPVGVLITPTVASPPPMSTSGNALAPTPAASEAVNSAEAKRKQQRQQRVVFLGLMGSFVILAVVAAIVIVSSSGSTSVKSAAARTNSAEPAASTQPETLANSKDMTELDPLKIAEATLAAAAPAKRSSEGDDRWVDAHHGTVACGSVKVRVKAVEVGKVRFTRATEKCLAVHLELTNTHDTKIREFTPRSGLPGLALVDNLENKYQLRSAKRKNDSIYPGSSLAETFFFQPPVSKAKTLRLQWPATAFGEEGAVRFEIPVTMIKQVEQVAGTSKAGDGSLTSPGQSDDGDMEEMPEGSAPAEREQPQISHAIQKAVQGRTSDIQSAKPASKRASDLSSLQKEIEKLGGGDMEEEDVADFESDPEAAKKIDAMRKQAEQTPEKNEKKNRRSRGG